MKNLVFIVAILLIGFGVTGWFMDWYTIAQAEGQEGRRRVEIEFDTQKIRKDTSELLERGQTKLQHTLKKTDSTKEAAAKEETAKQQPVKDQPKEGTQVTAGATTATKTTQ